MNRKREKRREKRNGNLGPYKKEETRNRGVRNLEKEFLRVEKIHSVSFLTFCTCAQEKYSSTVFRDLLDLRTHVKSKESSVYFQGL